MLCNDFEDRLTDYLDGVLEPDVHKTFAEHALRCPVVSRHSERSEKHNAGVSVLPARWKLLEIWRREFC